MVHHHTLLVGMEPGTIHTLIPNPYLCMSADIDVTPGNLKSKVGTPYPSLSTLPGESDILVTKFKGDSTHHGNMKPPKQASTWSGNPLSYASWDIASTGSTIP